MIRFVRLKQIVLMLSCIGFTALQPAYSAMFGGGDEEARRQIDLLRQQMTQQQQLTSDLSARLERIETLLQNGQQLTNLTSQIEYLRAELMKSQGKNDILTQELNNLQRRQQENYIDLDTKLRSIKISNVSTPMAGNSSQPTQNYDNHATGAYAQENNTVSKTPAPVKSTDKKQPINSKTPNKMANPAEKEKPDTKPSSSQPNSNSPKTESQAYESAYTLFQKGEYQPSMLEFKTFVEQHPKSSYVPSALYWIGNGFTKLKDYQSAITVQQRLISQFPKATKVPDAMLNIADAYTAVKDFGNAKKTYEQIMKKYPKTPIAEKAKSRLDSLKDN